MEELKLVDAAFYMSGLALLVSTAASILLIKLVTRVTSQASVTEGDTDEGKEEEGKEGGGGKGKGTREKQESTF